ncbi:tRNA-dihydrouridine synthase [Chloroflexota bacterium]
MANLRNVFCGREMRSPLAVAPLSMFSPAAVRAEKQLDRLMLWVEKGVGLVSTNTIYPKTINDYPSGKEPVNRWGLWEEKSFNKAMFIAADENLIMGLIDEGLKLVTMLKERCPSDVIVQASVTAGGSEPSSWVQHAKAFEEAGADIIELNVSCPVSVFHQNGTWAAEWLKDMPPNLLADMPELLSEVIKAVTKAVSIPVGWKASPETGYPRCLYAAKASYMAGARFVSYTNAPMSISPIDIYNKGKPLTLGFPFMDKNAPGVITGGLTRYVGRKTLAFVKNFIPELEVVGITGITALEHVVDYIMLGAQTVGLSSPIFWYGADFIEKCNDFLNWFMEKEGYQSIEDFRGLALKETEWDTSKLKWKFGELTAVTDPLKCDGCGICTQSICLASYLEGGIAKVAANLCSGCNMCTIICPRDARKVVIRKRPRTVGIL